MDKRKLQKELKRKYFPTFGMVIITLLGLFGLFTLLINGLFDIPNQKDLYNFISDNGMSLIYGTFFVCVSIYCWILYIQNVIMEPYEDVLFLVDDGEKNHFIDKYGRKVLSLGKINNEPNKYYTVYRTRLYFLDIIHEYIDKEPFEKEEKERYWYNIHFIGGESEHDILLLPIFYVLLIPGILCALIAREKAVRLIGLFFMSIPLITIIYDAYYKYNKNNGRAMDETQITKKLYKFGILIESITLILLLMFLFNVFINNQIEIIKILVGSLSVIVFVIFISNMFKLFDNNYINKFFEKFQTIIVIILWLIITSFFCIYISKETNDPASLYYMIAFWIPGIIGLIIEFIKKK